MVLKFCMQPKVKKTSKIHEQRQNIRDPYHLILCYFGRTHNILSLNEKLFHQLHLLKFGYIDNDNFQDYEMIILGYIIAKLCLSQKLTSKPGCIRAEPISFLPSKAKPELGTAQPHPGVILQKILLTCCICMLIYKSGMSSVILTGNAIRKP